MPSRPDDVNITERKESENILREAEQKFRFIVESATEFAIFTTDLHGRVNSWNTGAKRILGYDEEEIIGQDCRIFFTPEDNATDQPEAEMNAALSRGRGNDERWHVRKDGSRFWGSGLMMPLCDDAGNIRGYLKIFRDMTRQKRVEDALKDADRRKDEFLAVLAHELRNPLAAIGNAIQLLSLSGDSKTLEWSRSVIERQTRHLTRLVDDLLDVSRITKGRIQLKRERVDLTSIVRRAFEAVRPLVEQKNQSVELAMAPGELLVLADSTRIEQVLVNVLTNAIKFTPEGGQLIVSAQRSGQAVITVKDNGIGISPELLPRIFDLFAQGDRSIDRSQGGLGIGLNLARSLVEMHGGEIAAESEGLGHGTTVTICLPIADGTLIGSQQPIQQPLVGIARKDVRILVVDDNRDIAAGMARLLDQLGFKVRIANDGNSAIDLARVEQPHAILMDLGLPGVDGYEVARQLQREESAKNVFLIAISGYGQEADYRRSQEAGFDHHLTKPVDTELLVSLLRQRFDTADGRAETSQPNP